MAQLDSKTWIGAWLALAACADPTEAVYDDTETSSGTSGTVTDATLSASASMTTTDPDTTASTSASTSATTTSPTTDTDNTTAVDTTSDVTASSDSTAVTSLDTSSSDDDSSSSSTGDPGVCGNAIVEGGEECDDGAANDDEAPGACRTDCSAAGCGDSVVDDVLGEQCDDGNVAANDGCDGVCLVEVGASCGDDDLDIASGEECDDGNVADGDGCSANCQFEQVGADCGNGGIDGVELCDDGDTLNGDACNPTCNLENDVTFYLGQVNNPGLLDGVGAAARIDGIGGLAADDTYLWLADSENDVVRRITVATATITTIAGTGVAGDVDNAVGLAAQFSGAGSIATDGLTVWVGDGGNRKIKAIDIGNPTNPVTTIAGSGAQAVTDGFGAAAEFDDLRGVTYYAGFVYSVDANGAVLRRLDPTTGEVVTLAGQAYVTGNADGYGGAGTMTSPRYIASDNSGVLYIGDNLGYTIRYYNTVTTYLGTFAGDGTKAYSDGAGVAAQLHRVRGMTSDGTSIYWAEQEQNTIRQGVLASQEVSTLVGQHCDGVNPCAGGYNNAVGTAALLDTPHGVTFHYPSNSLFVLDGGNAVIRRIR